MWWLKLLILLLFAAAVVSLFRGLGALMRSDARGKDSGTARALTWRVIFSVAVFGLMMLSAWMGWLEPHDVNPTLRDGVPIEQSTPAP
ncbi:twin transmembrane helix small protein [Alcanivorax sp. JB21]|uniref:twin transmembrane helix small protein n=1 Tax=Alcanivorax limicola TaxID=2874102 RepID=UPI001CBB2B7E|nr:twin transmembrane helix small protein [Alcanivorax limicola]MBZ2188608.1 twin transmembrane helix small protein [Alcanivorax limicola]